MAKNVQLAAFDKRMDAIVKDFRAEIHAVLLKNANELADAIRHLAETSRDTGALIDSVTVTLPGQQTPNYSLGGGRVAGEFEYVVSVGNTEVRYPHLVEFGTAETDAQPFFWPAVRLLAKRFDNRVKRAIRKIIKKYEA